MKKKEDDIIWHILFIEPERILLMSYLKFQVNGWQVCGTMDLTRLVFVTIVKCIGQNGKICLVDLLIRIVKMYLVFVRIVKCICYINSKMFLLEFQMYFLAWDDFVQMAVSLSIQINVKSHS